MNRISDARKAYWKHDIPPWLHPTTDQTGRYTVIGQLLCSSAWQIPEKVHPNQICLISSLTLFDCDDDCDEDCEGFMLDMIDGQNIPLKLNSFSSWQSWHPDIVKIREPQKAKSSCHGYQSLNRHRSWITSALDRFPDSNHPVEGSFVYRDITS